MTAVFFSHTSGRSNYPGDVQPPRGYTGNMCGQPPNSRRLSLSLCIYIYSNVFTQIICWFNRSTKYICWLLHEHNQHLCLVASSLPGYILYDFTVSVHMVVSWNTSRSSISYIFSIINHPLWGIPVYDTPIRSYACFCLYVLVHICILLYHSPSRNLRKSPRSSRAPFPTPAVALRLPADRWPLGDAANKTGDLTK